MRHSLAALLSYVCLPALVLPNMISTVMAQDSPNSFCAMEFVVGGSEGALKMFESVFSARPEYKITDCNLRDHRPNAPVKVRASDESIYMIKGVRTDSEFLVVRCNMPHTAVIYAATDSFVRTNGILEKTDDSLNFQGNILLACLSGCVSKWCAGSPRCVQDLRPTLPLSCAKPCK